MFRNSHKCLRPNICVRHPGERKYGFLQPFAELQHIMLQFCLSISMMIIFTLFHDIHIYNLMIIKEHKHRLSVPQFCVKVGYLPKNIWISSRVQWVSPLEKGIQIIRITCTFLLNKILIGVLTRNKELSQKSMPIITT